MILPLLLWTSALTASCQPVSSDRITAADVAAVIPAFSQIAPQTVIGYTPQPGSNRRLDPAELTRLAAASGVDYHGLTSVCFEPAVAELKPAEIESAIRSALGALSASAEIEVLDYSRFPAPAGELVFPIESLPAWAPGNTAVWNGYIEHGRNHFSVWARVHITVPRTRVVAVRDIRPGAAIGKNDLRLEEASVFPSRVAPLTSADAVSGRIAKRFLPAGTTVTTLDLTEPWDVSRGDMVTVDVISGNTALRFEAESQTDGRAGQTIMLRNTTSGKVFSAEVTGKGRTRIECRSAEDLP